jgi:hypothetical protein
MPVVPPAGVRKRPVNLTLGEALADDAVHEAVASFPDEHSPL